MKEAGLPQGKAGSNNEHAHRSSVTQLGSFDQSRRYVSAIKRAWLGRAAGPT